MAKLDINLASERAPEVLAILRQVDIRQLAQLPPFSEQWRFNRMQGDCLLVNCLYHADSNPSMGIYSDHTFCFSCKHRGDVVDMIRRVTGCSFPAALELILAYKATYNIGEDTRYTGPSGYSQAESRIAELLEEGPLPTRYTYWTKQLNDKPWGKWHFMQDTPENRKKFKSYGAAFFTVLSVDRPNPPCWYFGDWYMDLDGENASDDLQVLIKEFYPYLKVWETGKKGFHAILPVKAASPKLPLVFGDMSAQLNLPSLDMRVYSLGRGRMWREEGVLRTNGRRKTRII